MCTPWVGTPNLIIAPLCQFERGKWRRNREKREGRVKAGKVGSLDLYHNRVCKAGGHSIHDSALHMPLLLPSSPTPLPCPPRPSLTARFERAVVPGSGGRAWAAHPSARSGFFPVDGREGNKRGGREREERGTGEGHKGKRDRRRVKEWRREKMSKRSSDRRKGTLGGRTWTMWAKERHCNPSFRPSLIPLPSFLPLPSPHLVDDFGGGQGLDQVGDRSRALGRRPGQGCQLHVSVQFHLVRAEGGSWSLQCEQGAGEATGRHARLALPHSF